MEVYHYKQLFAIKDPDTKDKIRFPMTTDGRNKDTLKTTIGDTQVKRY